MIFSKNETVVLNSIITLFVALITAWIIKKGFLIDGALFCLAGILIEIWFNIRRTRHSPLNIFPLLNISALKKWALKVSDKYKHINKIVLFEAPIEVGVKYILFFDFDTTKPDGLKNKNHFSDKQWKIENYPLDNNFREVYKNDPQNDFIGEWRCQHDYPVGVNKRLSLLLYP